MPKVSQEHQEARKNQIIEAAIECFSKKGFHRTSMQDIILESGLSPGAIYLYFKSKEEIIKAVAALRHAKERAMIAEAFRSEDINQALSKLLETFAYPLTNDSVKKERIIGVQLWGEALNNPSVYEIVRQGIDEPIKALIEVLNEYQSQKLLPPELSTEAIARVILAQFQGFVLQFLLDQDLDIKEFVKAINYLVTNLSADI